MHSVSSLAGVAILAAMTFFEETWGKNVGSRERGTGLEQKGREYFMYDYRSINTLPFPSDMYFFSTP